MAETFGIVTGAASIASLLTTCVEVFQYIQIDKASARDHEQSCIQLSFLQLRLTRWGTAAGVYQDRKFNDPAISDPDLKLVKDTLSQLLHLFDESKRMLKITTSAQPPDSSVAVLHNANTKQQALTAVFDTNQTIVTDREKYNRRAPSLRKRVCWVLYEKSNLLELIGGISKLVEELEKLVPAEGNRKQLASEEISRLQDVTERKLLQKVVESVDDVLRVQLKLSKERTSGHHYGTVSARDSSRATTGNYYSSTFQGQVKQHASHFFDNIDVSGEANVFSGDVYGGKGPFD